VAAGGFQYPLQGGGFRPHGQQLALGQRPAALVARVGVELVQLLVLHHVVF
jgi:hypothetical protein